MASGRVLVVDDEAIAHQTVARLLEHEGHRIDAAFGGAEALHKLGWQEGAAPEGAPYDCLICDLRMPDMDGLALVERVRQQADGPQVMILTGYATIESAARAVNAGARGYFTKPIQDVAQFRAQVREAVQVTQRSQTNRRWFADLVLGKASTPLTTLPQEDPELIQRIFQAVHGGVVVVDCQGHVLYATVTAAQLLGEEYRRLQGAAFPQYIAETDGEKFTALLAQLGSGRPLGEITIALRTRLERAPVVTIRAAPVYFQRQMYAAVLTLTEITEFVAMQERCAFLTEIIERTEADMLFVVRPSGHIVECNETARAVFGYPKNDLLAHPIDELLYSDTPALWHSVITTMVERFSWRGEMMARAHGGRIFPVEVTIRRASAPRAAGVLICSCHDITEQKVVERMKSDFLESVSHELRTPLCILQGAVENLLMGVAGPLSESQQALAVSAQRGCGRLTRLVTDLLELSRWESGRMTLHRQAVPIATLVEEAAATARAAAGERGLEVVVAVPPALPSWAADREQMAQVLYRLIENAVRFARHRVTIQATRVAIGGAEQVQVSVCDDGAGVAPEEMAELFQKFGQVSRPVGPGYHGVGLGLAICKEIVERNQGMLWAERGAREGMAFHLRLPIVRGEPRR